MEPQFWLVWFISGSLSSLLPVSFMHPPLSTRRHPKALLCYCLPPPVQPTWQSPASIPSPPAAAAAAAWIRSARPVQTSRFCVGSGRGGSLGADTHEADPSFAPVRCSFTSWSEGRGGGRQHGVRRGLQLCLQGWVHSSSVSQKAVKDLIPTMTERPHFLLYFNFLVWRREVSVDGRSLL